MEDVGDMGGDIGGDVDVAGDAGGNTVATELPVMNLVKAPAKTKPKVAGLDDDKAALIRESHETVQIRKTIYSAAALDSTFWPTAFLTFCLQVVILVLYLEEDFSAFERDELVGEGWDLFSLALGRFVSYFLIWTNTIADLQNAVNLIFCTEGSDRLLGGCQLVVVLTYPFAWVCAIQSSATFKDALTATGILAMFLRLDETISSILDLGLLKREIGELVHTIENPLAPGVRETIMNIALMTYTCVTFFYVWVVALDLYPVAIVLWFGFTVFFFRAFYLDMKDSKKVLEKLELVEYVKSALHIDETEEDQDKTNAKEDLDENKDG